MDTASRYFSPHVLAVGNRQREIKSRRKSTLVGALPIDQYDPAACYRLENVRTCGFSCLVESAPRVDPITTYARTAALK